MVRFRQFSTFPSIFVYDEYKLGDFMQHPRLSILCKQDEIDYHKKYVKGMRYYEKKILGFTGDIVYGAGTNDCCGAARYG